MLEILSDCTNTSGTKHQVSCYTRNQSNLVDSGLHTCEGDKDEGKIE